MDWSDLVGKVIGLGAPMLGGALGGPFGAAAGKILADALNTSTATPDAVSDALSNADDPAAAALAAQAAESNWLAALAEIGKAQVAEVGATQRAEIASDDWLQRLWRPLYSLELTVECFALMATLLHGLWTGHDAAINGFASLSALLMAYWVARFGVLGVYVTGRTREKQASMTGELPPSVLGELLKIIVKKK